MNDDVAAALELHLALNGRSRRGCSKGPDTAAAAPCCKRATTAMPVALPGKRVKREIQEIKLEHASSRRNLAVDLRLLQLCCALSFDPQANSTEASSDEARLQQLVVAYRSTHPPTEAATAALMGALFELRQVLFYQPEDLVPAWQLTAEAEVQWDSWGSEGFRARGAHAPAEPGTVPCKQALDMQRALDNRLGFPIFAPNALCTVARVDSPGDPLDGQLELVAATNLAGGTLLPWIGQLQLQESSEIDRYEFKFNWWDSKLIVKPDARCAATYTNDYCGADRSDQNKSLNVHKLNCHFCVLADWAGRPFTFLHLNKAVKKGEALWIDYGELV